MLCRQGQQNGTLTIVSESKSELKFRWQVPGFADPCMTAQIWRPSQAGHKSDGAWVSGIPDLSTPTMLSSSTP